MRSFAIPAPVVNGVPIQAQGPGDLRDAPAGGLEVFHAAADGVGVIEGIGEGQVGPGVQFRDCLPWGTQSLHTNVALSGPYLKKGSL